MKRKIIQIAESTQLVSLPRKWAVLHNLKKGDEVEVVENGDSVIINSNKEAKPETTRLDLTKIERLAERYLIAAYRSGYDEVEVVYEDPSMLQRLQQLASSILMGFEIVNQSEHMCVFRNISSTLSSEFDNVLRRVFFITLALAKSTYEALDQKNYERLREGFALETTNNKFTLFCQRLLNKEGGGSHRRTNFLFLTVYQLEKIADHYKYICERVLKSKPKRIRPDILKLFEEVNKLLQGYYEFFYKFDAAQAEDLARTYARIESLGERTFTSAPSSEDEVVYDLLSIAQLTFNLVSVQIGLKV